jgi:uncharacterized protein
MRDRLLAASAHLAGRWPKSVLAVALVLAVASIWLAATRLVLNANTDDLISPERPYMQRYRRFLEEVGDTEFIYVVVAHDDAPAAARAAVDELAQALERRDDLDLRALHARIEPEEQRALGSWAMSDTELEEFLLPAGVYGDLVEDPHPAAVLRRAQQRLNRLLAAGAFVSDERRREIGAELLFLVEALAAAAGPGEAREAMAGLLSAPDPEYLVSRSGKLFYLQLLPQKDYGTLAVIEKPLAIVREVMAEIGARHPEVEIGLTGKPVLQADEMATSDRDMARSTAVAVVLVALLFMLVMGGILRPVLAVATLLIGIAWTFGFTTLVIGQLNLLSVVFTLILVGIGIDFGVHLVSRYREERRRLGPSEARLRSLVAVGRGNTTGAITSSLAFFMATLTDFRGLEELGLIAGSGLVLCMISMTFVLPALLTLTDRDPRPTNPEGSVPEPFRAPEGRTPGRGALILAAILIVGAVLFAPRVGFDDNILDLQAEELDSVRWERRIVRDAGAETWFGLAAYEDMNELETAVARAQVEVEREGSSLGSHRSVLDLIAPPNAARTALLEGMPIVPPPPSEDSARPSLDLDAEALRELARDLAKLARRARESAPQEAERIMRRARDLDGVATDLAPPRLAELSRGLEALASGLRGVLEGAAKPLQAALPRAIRDLYVAPRGQYLLALHPRGNVWDSAVMEDYVAAMRRVDSEVTGVPITHHESIRDMRSGFLRAALFALLAVVLVVFLDFRRLLPTLLALLPVGVGGLWLAGAMGLLGLNFNLANFFSVPILIGIGVDNGIHLVHRWRETGTAELGDTKRGVFLTSMTTAIGFGCLSFASHRGLQSLGQVMALGSLAILVASLLVLPSLLRWLRR